MPKIKRLEAIEQSKTGLNKKFIDKSTGQIFTRGQIADNIDNFPGYHIMRKDGKRIIRSNPDGKENNNLG